jgi:hypothetical protein
MEHKKRNSFTNTGNPNGLNGPGTKTKQQVSHVLEEANDAYYMGKGK